MGQEKAKESIDYNSILLLLMIVLFEDSGDILRRAEKQKTLVYD